MRALLSVHDKTGLGEFGRGLSEAGYEVFASGGTAAALSAAGVPVRPAESLGGQREVLGGRVKTLQAAIAAAILARRDRPEDMQDLREIGAEPIDLVAVNLYPFPESPGIETIDIGGPTLLRAAAKNWAWVAAVSDPGQYGEVLGELRSGGGRLGEATRRRLALEVFRGTAFYDATIAAWLAGAGSGPASGGAGAPGPAGPDLGAGPDPDPFPDPLILGWRRSGALRYGENPHQAAALYRDPLGAGGGRLLDAPLLQGKALSYNNLCDAQAAWELCWELAGMDGAAAVAVKHGGPCGAAVAPDLAEAYRRCHAADPVSIFGGVVALSRPVDGPLAERLGETFLEVLLAPDFDEEAQRVLARRRNLRVLRAGAPGPGEAHDYRLRRISGGVLVQAADRTEADTGSWRAVTRAVPGEADLREMRFAWTVVRHVASNAIVVCRDGRTAGVGGGQPNRIGAARIALEQAGEAAAGAVLASDGFFPFPDVVEAAARAGVRAIVQPGGSVRDADSVAAADAAGIAMVVTGVRHFRH